MDQIRNAIVVMMDSWTATYTGCYGNTVVQTPNIDRLAREGIVFENAYAESSPTIPCRRAMHTGRYTLHEIGWAPLRIQETTIADLCWGQGIDTALVYDCPMYRLPKFCFTRGFDKAWFIHGHEGDHHYYDRHELVHYKVEDFMEPRVLQEADKILGERVVGPHLEEVAGYLHQTQFWKSVEDQRCIRTFKNAAEYIKRCDKNQPFYLWVDCFDPHEPWDVPSVYDKNKKCPYDPDYTGVDQFHPLHCEVKDIYTEAEMQHIRALYAEKITLCDTAIGLFLDTIRALGLWENTLLLLTSDHGEPLGNGEHGHGIMRKVRPWPYEELVRIPLIIKAPGIKANQRSVAFAQSCDVAPTILEWLGLDIHPDMTGKSLLGICFNKEEKVRDFAIAGYYKYSWSIITDEWSYIHWVKNDKLEGVSSKAMSAIYAEGSMEAAAHVKSDSAEAKIVLNGATNSVHARLKEAATLDGEDQWTCTPGSEAKVPEKDELYNRKTDRTQQHNCIEKHPEVARELLKTLKNFIGQLQTL